METYQKPITEIVLVTTNELMQGVVVTSGSEGSGVIDDPVNPDPGTELSNHSYLWDEEDDISFTFKYGF